jgi:hypothetical protein
MRVGAFIGFIGANNQCLRCPVPKTQAFRKPSSCRRAAPIGADRLEIAVAAQASHTQTRQALCAAQFRYKCYARGTFAANVSPQTCFARACHPSDGAPCIIGSTPTKQRQNAVFFRFYPYWRADLPSPGRCRISVARTIHCSGSKKPHDRLVRSPTTAPNRF